MGRLEGKCAIVTGGASGMGASHCRRFVAEGAKVVCTDISVDAGQALAEELGSNCRFIKHDVSNADDWMQICKEAQSFGPLSILVNNAGIAHESPIEQFDEADYHRVIAVNLTGPFLGCRTVVPVLKQAGGGAIVNISSAAGLKGAPKGSIYCASKFGVRGMSKALAIELAEFNIRVNSVHPGVIDTPMIKGLDVPAMAQQIVPLRRVAEPEEVTNLVLFLASDEARYCTGGEYTVDGGFTA